jgi:hypothetical protein
VFAKEARREVGWGRRMERWAKPNGKNRTENVDLRETMKKTTKRNIKGEEKSLKSLKTVMGGVRE